MSKKLLKIFKDTDVWNIIGTEERDDDLINSKLFYDCKDNIDLYYYVETALKSNNIQVSEEKLGNINSIITKNDLILIELDSLENEKSLAISQVSDSLSSRTNILNQLEIFNFIVSNNKLLEHGYYITDENKDKIFIEIISSENEELISDLEIYLYAKDYITSSYMWYDKFKEFKKNIINSKTSEEIQTLLENFLDTIY